MPHTRGAQQLCTQILSARSGEARVLVAVADPPGAGKSMLTADLVASLRALLVAVWLDHGLTEQDAERHADRNDIVNARTALDHSAPVDLVLVLKSEGIA